MFHCQLTRNQSLICSFSKAFWWVRSTPSTTAYDSSAMQVSWQVLSDYLPASGSKFKSITKRCHVCYAPDVQQEMQCYCPNCPHIGNVSNCIIQIRLQEQQAFSWCNSMEAYIQQRRINSLKRCELCEVMQHMYILKNFSSTGVDNIGHRISSKIALCYSQ